MAWAGSTEVVSLDVQTTNYTGFVIAADAVTSHVPDRSEITGAFALDFTWDGGDDVAVNYEALFRFEDENGIAQSIVDSAGGPQVTEISSVNQVTMSSSHLTNSRAFTVAFEPATRLLPHKHYTIKARWRKIPVGGNYTAYAQVPVDSSAAATSDYYHFNSTTSNDAVTNAQIRVRLNQWDRPWMIAGSATQGSIRFVTEIRAVRYDAFEAATAAATVPIRLQVSLKDALGVIVWTSPTTVDTEVSVNSHQSTFDPAGENINAVVDLVPPAGVLNAGENYTPVIVVTHDDGAGYIADGTTTVSSTAMMRLAGTLSFGNIETTFDQLVHNPSAGMTYSPPTCTLVIPENHGFITGATDTFYSGTLDDVQIEPSGHAIFTGAYGVFVVGSGLTKTINGVSLELSASLSASGATGEALVYFPDGFCIAGDMTAIAWKGRYRFTVGSYNNALELPSTLSYPGVVFCQCDQVPLIMQTSSLSFNSQTGSLFISSGTWIDPLNTDKNFLSNAYTAGELVDPASRFRPSNIFHYGLAHGDSFTNVEIAADAVGRAQFQQAHLDFSAGDYAPHFPLMFGVGLSEVTTITGGSMTFSNGGITSSSFLNVGAMTLAYLRDMATGPCTTSAGPGLTQITPMAPFKFTSDGGLVGDVSIDSPTPVSWGALPTAGEFAHQLPLYATGAYHMPGHRLAGDVSSSIERDARPVALLYTGAEESGYLERPDDESYSADGLANYAGLTLRGAGSGTAVSRLAGVATTYELSPNSRYYIRPSGVTGITDATGGFTVSPLYGGMSLGVNSYRLAFIDNFNTNSATTGSLSVGSSNPSASPVDLQFAFTKLFFGPQGQLTASELSPNELNTERTLRYWQTTFKPLAMSFRQPVPDSGACATPDEGFLTIAVEATLPLLPHDKVQGVLGFRGNGDLLGKGDPLTEGTGIDSRFQLPSNVSVAGPGGNYVLQPVVRAYLNRWDRAHLSSDRPASGFLSVAGRLDVPFFESMKLHLHADSMNNVFFMGGWGAADNEATSNGWTEPGNSFSFFNKVDFDAPNIGFAGNNVDDYRNDASEAHNPRVFKNWFDMVDFDYTLKRSSAGYFQSVQPKPGMDLLLFKIKSEITRLTPTAAEINFDADLQATMPKLSITSLASSTGLVDGLASKFSSALGGFDVASLTSALGGVDGLVRDSLADSIKPQVESGMESVVDAIYAQLQTSYAAVGNQVGTPLITSLQAPAVVDAIAVTAQAAVSNLASTGTSALTDNAADRVEALKTQAQTLASAVQGISTSAATLGTAVGAISGGSSQAVEGVAATLNAAAVGLSSTAATLGAAENELRAGSSALFSELQNVASAQSTGVNTMATKAMQDLAGMLLLLNAADGQLFSEYPQTELKRRIRVLLVNRFFASPVASEYQRLFKSHLNPLRDEVQKLTDQIMAELEAAARQSLNIPPVISQAQGSSFSDVIKSSGLRGFARINGDSLERLRLDGEFNLSIVSSSDEAGGGSDGMKMKGWMEIQSIHSDAAASACNGLGGQDGLTLEIGAKDVPISWGTASGDAYASVKFGLVDGEPISFDGVLGINGSFDTGGFKFTEPKIVLGAGPDSLYAGFALRAAFNGKEVAGRAILGQICGTGPLQIIDPKAHSVVNGIINEGHPELNSLPLLGGSLYAEAWFPLNEIIGIPTTCLLNLRAGMGAGFMCWKPIGGSSIIVGTQQSMGLSGEILCCFNATGSLSMTGAGILANPPVISMKGVGSVSAEIGVCPFCEDFSKSISAGATFNLKTGAINSTGFNF